MALTTTGAGLLLLYAACVHTPAESNTSPRASRVRRHARRAGASRALFDLPPGQRRFHGRGEYA
jgi:hypothetical protein